jgi:hypothetical protein
MSGATFSLLNQNPLQVQFALCINLPASRPTNATYGSSNSDASLKITTDTTNLRINNSLGTSGQVLTSGGAGPAYWSSVVGATGPAGAVGAQGPAGPTGPVSGLQLVSKPISSQGATGDHVGMIAIESNFGLGDNEIYGKLYFCIANYDGETHIWKSISGENNTWFP